jgi:hypothetical protein
MVGKPSDSAAQMRLITDAPYEASTRVSLEGYVGKQAMEGSYDFEANRALLKIYQCFPDQTNMDCVVKSLVLSLMRLPRIDYLSLTSLLSTKMIRNADVLVVQKASDMLEAGRFKEFWAHCVSEDWVSKVFKVTGFEDAIRVHIVKLSMITFSTVSKPELQALLGFFDPTHLDKFCSTLGAACVAGVSGETVTMKKSAQNSGKGQAGPGEAGEGALKLDDVMKFLQFVEKK